MSDKHIENIELTEKLTHGYGNYIFLRRQSLLRANVNLLIVKLNPLSNAYD